MIPNIVRGSDPAGLVRYLFGRGRRNEHTDQHLVCASGDMFPSFDMDGKPAASYAEIGRRFDRRYRVHYDVENDKSAFALASMPQGGQEIPFR